jgi:hypothetical protein
VRPIDFPRSFAGTTEVNIAIEVPKIIALDIPCKTLKKINIGNDKASPHPNDVTEKKNIPVKNTFFRPIISATRPNGSKKAAVAIR